MTKPQKWILIVEDEAEIAQSVASFLEREGYKTIQTQTVLDAAAKIRNQRFDLVLLDLRLKNGLGVKVIESIQTDLKAATRQTPVIIISGHLDVEIVRGLRGKIAGAFVKPFDPWDLIVKIKTILDDGK